MEGSMMGHRKLVIFNLVALGVLLVLLLVFGGNLHKSSVSERQIQHRFFNLERKIQKEDARIRRMIAIKHEVRLLEKEWQFIVQKLKALKHDSEKVKVMTSEVHKIQNAVKELSKGLEKEHAERVVHEYQEEQRRPQYQPQQPVYQMPPPNHPYDHHDHPDHNHGHHPDHHGQAPDDHHRPQGHHAEGHH